MAQSTRCSLGEGGVLRLGKRRPLEILRSLEKKKLSGRRETRLPGVTSYRIVDDTRVPFLDNLPCSWIFPNAADISRNSAFDRESFSSSKSTRQRFNPLSRAYRLRRERERERKRGRRAKCREKRGREEKKKSEIFRRLYARGARVAPSNFETGVRLLTSGASCIRS